MRILGISCFYHDAAAALIEDGRLIAAAEEERFSRKKHDADFPKLAIRFCLETGALSAPDLDYVVFYEKPFLKFERILLSSLQTFPWSCGTFRQAMTTWLLDKLWVKTLIHEQLGIPEDRILFSEHHLSHAASAFLCSPFEEAAILTADAVGEWATTTMAVGRASWTGQPPNAIRMLREMRFPHSLGLLYSAFTAFLGFEVNEGEYKVMGMAPYGTPRYVDEVWHLLRLADRGGFQLDMSYFSFHHSARQSFTRKFEQLFGPPRDPKAPFVTGEFGDELDRDQELLRQSRHYADIGASIQRVTEEIMLSLARELYKETGIPRLCLAGGVAYNSAANGRIMRETPFQEVYIQPAAGDSGGALGAALYAYHVILQQPRRFIMEHAYWGKAFDERAIAEAVQRHGLSARRLGSEQEAVRETVRHLVDGRVVGWYQGRCEWGPRALGNRSILADPRRKDMKAIVNRKIKFREPFRPFAPSILDRSLGQFVDYPIAKGLAAARFMLCVSPIRPERRETIPAVTHVDGTGRLQAVEQAANPLYYRLIEAFEAETGVPVVLNTSFNLKGEPIVNRPDEAISTFLRSDMDALVMGTHLVTKNHPEEQTESMNPAPLPSVQSKPEMTKRRRPSSMRVEERHSKGAG
ncbi:MAG: carbamoyltransferase [Candidatus Omnitrophica bacterium]|nr:carbamoyltransferase [Candidatus Omnitrophota bacterium]